MTRSIDATYSAEDNKLRLYADSRLDAENYARVREAGFRWAPKQELFVAPSWSPAREDLCIELAGVITAEQTTLVERAETKVERLEGIAVKRAQQANSFQEAASRIAKRFADGQPILIGHHSEKKARRDQAKIHANMEKSVKASSAIEYWEYRVTGVERHANRKSAPSVIARRIKTLLKDLRDQQRAINHAHICSQLWADVSAISDPEKFRLTAEHYAGASLKTGQTAPFGTWSKLRDGELDHREFVTDILTSWEQRTQSDNRFRWINHILNRLGYERSELSDVQRFTGELTPVILQAFAREHGAHKPKANNDTDGNWTLTSSVPLPAHIADDSSFTASTEQWQDIMQSAGYCVPEPKPRRTSTKVQVPLINLSRDEANRLQAMWNATAKEKHSEKVLGEMQDSAVYLCTQAHFSAHSKGSYSNLNTIELDKLGNKVWSSYKGKSAAPVCRIRSTPNNNGIYSANRVIVITDKPSKPLPIEWDAVPTDTAS